MSKNKITVIHPELTKEERERRMRIIKEATAVFIREAEEQLRNKNKL